MNFMPLLIFIGKATVIEFAIEALRFGIYSMWHNALPPVLFLTHHNRYIHWLINGFETLSVITLLYFNVNILIITFSVLCLTFAVKYLCTVVESRFYKA